jgi:hypothetical protein
MCAEMLMALSFELRHDSCETALSLIHATGWAA